MSALSPALRRLRDYVAIPSVNPMGRDDVPDDVAGERRYAEHVRGELRRLGVDAELVGRADRPSVVGEARASGGDTLLVASHLDTVPIDGMVIDPFDPVVRDGRMYGRGSCDTKAGMAALIAALERVLERGTLRRSLVLVGEADEEFGTSGAREVLESLGSHRPDWAIATEPTALRTVTAHKGIAFAKLVAEGRARHGSDPGAGRNAIVALARAVLALDALGVELAAAPDPRLGPGTLSVGLVGGGHAPNTVPDAAWLVADRRLLPGEDAASLRAEIEAALARHGVEHVRVEACEARKPPLDTPDDHPAVRACSAALTAAGRTGGTAAVAFGTDAGVLARGGIPSVVLGPGSIEQAHTADEFVPLDEVDAMTEVYVHLLESPGN